MNDNVASFDQFGSDLQIDAHSTGLPRVILEGATDLWLFKDVWFSNYLAKFEFLPAARLVKGSGCTAVPRAVKFSRDEDNIPAFGILDRDVYFKEKRWDALYEPEEARFRSHATQEHVFVSELWEIEAHLLLPEFLRNWVMGCSKNPMASRGMAANAVVHSLDQCEILFTAAPYMAACHVDQLSSNKSFGALPLEQVKQHCAAGLAKLSPEAQAQAEAVTAFIAAVRAQAPNAADAKLRYYLRFIDTKKLLERLRTAFQLHDGRDNQNVLAAFMNQASREPEEFAQHLATLAVNDIP